MSNPAQLEEGSLKTPPKIYIYIFSLVAKAKGRVLVSPRMQPARVHRCSRAGCSIDPDHYIMYFTFLGSPKAKLSIAAARRPVFVSTLQHCRLGKLVQPNLPGVSPLRGGSLVQCYGCALPNFHRCYRYKMHQSNLYTHKLCYNKIYVKN